MHNKHPNHALFENYLIVVVDNHKARFLTIHKDTISEGDHITAAYNKPHNSEGSFTHANGTHGGLPEEKHVMEQHSHDFSKEVCAKLLEIEQNGDLYKLIICAPARMMNHMEKNIHSYVEKKLEKKVSGEFINMSADDILSHC